MATTTFSWANYTRPTPSNIEYFAASLRRLVSVATGTTVIMGARWWIPVVILFVGALLDELKNFAAHVAEGEKEVFQVSIPSELADQIEVTKQTVPATEDPNKKA